MLEIFADIYFYRNSEKYVEKGIHLEQYLCVRLFFLFWIEPTRKHSSNFGPTMTSYKV